MDIYHSLLTEFLVSFGLIKNDFKNLRNDHESKLNLETPPPLLSQDLKMIQLIF